MSQIQRSRARVRAVSVESKASEAAYDRSLLRQAEALLDLITQLTG